MSSVRQGRDKLADRCIVESSSRQIIKCLMKRSHRQPKPPAYLTLLRYAIACEHVSCRGVTGNPGLPPHPPPVSITLLRYDIACEQAPQLGKMKRNWSQQEKWPVGGWVKTASFSPPQPPFGHFSGRNQFLFIFPSHRACSQAGYATDL